MRYLMPVALFALSPGPAAQALDDVSTGRLLHIDGAARIITLSDGVRYAVAGNVKLSARKLGEIVLVTYRRGAYGREAIEIRRAPEFLRAASNAATPSK